MATEAQIAANRANALKSTGPRTAEGKAKSACNSLQLGIFTTNNCVPPEDREFYDEFCYELWLELAPANAVEELNAAEFIRAAWRLRRCALADEKLGWATERLQAKRAQYSGVEKAPSDPMLEGDTAGWQASIDRARGQAHAAFRRAQNDLARLRKEREIREEHERAAIAKPVEACAVLHSHAAADEQAPLVAEGEAAPSEPDNPEMPRTPAQNEPNLPALSPQPAANPAALPIDEPGSGPGPDPNTGAETERTQFHHPLTRAA
ncbi:MAG: hypothetical protein KGN84_14460 [Acidobacteriota bacterium]|nr:hypothetical protein [Acidobacteriota bacterium]